MKIAITSSLLLRFALGSGLGLVACGGSNENDTAKGREVSSSTARATSTPSMSARAGAASAVASTSASSMLPVASAGASAGAAVNRSPAALAEAAAAAEIEKSCGGFVKAVDVYSEAHPSPDAAGAIAETAKKPPSGVTTAQAERCRDLMLDDLRATTFRGLATELLGQAMKAAQKETMDGAAAICPSAKPIPSDIAAVTATGYRAKPTEWDDAGWKCLGGATMTLAKGALPGQIEYRLAADRRSFEAIARRPATKPGASPLEYVARAMVDPTTHAMVMAPSVEVR